MRVCDVMTNDVETIDADMTLQEAAEKMKELGIGILPVRQNGAPIGMVTDRDITIRATAVGKDPHDTYVREIMTEEVISCNENDPAKEAFETMRKNGVGRLLVKNPQGEVCGIITMASLFSKAGDDMWECIANTNTPLKAAS